MYFITYYKLCLNILFFDLFSFSSFFFMMKQYIFYEIAAKISTSMEKRTTVLKYTVHE